MCFVHKYIYTYSIILHICHTNIDLGLLVNSNNLLFFLNIATLTINGHTYIFKHGKSRLITPNIIDWHFDAQHWFSNHNHNHDSSTKSF